MFGRGAEKEVALFRYEQKVFCVFKLLCSHEETVHMFSNMSNGFRLKNVGQLTCNPYAGSTQLVAETTACEMTCPPKTPLPLGGIRSDLERNKFVSKVSTSREVEMSSCST